MAMTFFWIMRSMPAMPMADQERPDRGWDEADQQGGQHSHGHRRPLPGRADSVERERQQRGRGQQEDDRHGGQQDVEGGLVGGLLAPGAFHQRDHAIEERLARVGVDLDDEPVRQHLGAAGDRAAIATALADDRGALPRDRALIHRGHALDDRTVDRDEIAGLDQDDLALAQRRGGDELHLRAALGAA
jgi:hypothetical protein